MSCGSFYVFLQRAGMCSSILLSLSRWFWLLLDFPPSDHSCVMMVFYVVMSRRTNNYLALRCDQSSTYRLIRLTKHFAKTHNFCFNALCNFSSKWSQYECTNEWGKQSSILSSSTKYPLPPTHRQKKQFQWILMRIQNRMVQIRFNSREKTKIHYFENLVLILHKCAYAAIGVLQQRLFIIV